MTTVEVGLEKSYEIIIGRDVLGGLGGHVKAVSGAEKALIVTDGNVEKLYFAKAAASLAAAGFEVYGFVFEAGEKSKTAETYLKIIDCLGSHGFRRTDTVVALGGGVVGDISGFAAATYMRGIDLVQVPTTLLAMTDSSIGGKTGVDLAYGKNLLGAFYQPRLVLADISVLSTLPDREWRCGIGEGIKYACLAGGRIAQILMDGLDDNALEEFVALCAKYKADIVARDEREGGLRKLLNLGHTVGHAVEKISGYSVPHGEAVAYGISRMAKAAVAHGEMSETDYDIICAMLSKYGMETSLVSGDIAKAIRMDKKAEGGGKISIVKIAGIGNCSVTTMKFEEFESYILQ